MLLTQYERDRVLVFAVAEMARKRRAKGLRLNHPEAVALITDEMLEAAREGADIEAVRAVGTSTLAAADVLPGVPALVRGLRVECSFGDGARLLVLPDPIPDPLVAADDLPGRTTFADGAITLNDGRPVTTIAVRNTSGHPVQVASHFPFDLVNRRLEFDRAAAVGRHLDLQAGRSILFEPGEARQVDLVPFAGAGIVQGVAPPIGPGVVSVGVDA